MHPGQGPGLSLHDLGETGGSATTTLLESETPAHTHAIQADAADPADVQAPSASVALARSQGGNAYQTNTAGLVSMASTALASVGGSQPHNNMQPYLTMNFCIALQGVFPPRT
jgi:microcystin-dependent protein